IHICSNVALLLLIGCEVERRYGLPRTVALYLLTAVGGNLLSAIAEAHCAVVVGLSGAIFGFMPLYVLDICKHWRDMTAPALQVFFFLVFLVTFGASIIRQPTGISHLSHVGGLVIGIFPALLYQYHVLPHHDDADSVHHLRVHPTTLEKLEMALPIVSSVVLTAYFVTLFAVFYKVILPGVSCPALQ
ncbi:MAG: rhomboid family intramembrane serine protease, partial [Deltaproteobacteria bacterium]